MHEFETPVFALNLSDPLNPNRIIGAKVGQPVRVSVYTPYEENKNEMLASGVRVDEEIFRITVNTSDGYQSHDWSWQMLLDALNAN
jgi:hypothetical protein